MKNIVNLFFLSVITISCTNNVEISSIDPINWENRMIDYPLSDSLEHGVTYLSIYSQIYSQTEQLTHNLTATVSLRNTNRYDTIYIKKAEYYDTHGTFIRSYFDKTIFIAPLETVEIIIDERDKEGGTGANFLFEWEMRPDTHEPYFEGVMISTYGSQGLSFTTQGIRIE